MIQSLCLIEILDCSISAFNRIDWIDIVTEQNRTRGFDLDSQITVFRINYIPFLQSYGLKFPVWYNILFMIQSLIVAFHYWRKMESNRSFWSWKPDRAVSIVSPRNQNKTVGVSDRQGIKYVSILLWSLATLLFLFINVKLVCVAAQLHIARKQQSQSRSH